jgi:hypothetical protein
LSTAASKRIHRRLAVGEQCAEQGEEAVAQELVDDAAVAVDDCNHLGEEVVEQRHGLLGRARPRHRGEAADVEEHREQHGKDDRLCPHALLFAAQDLASQRLRVAVSCALRHRGQASQRMALRRGHGKKPRCK